MVNVCSLNIRRFILTTPELFLSLTLNRFIMKFCFTFLYQLFVTHFFTRLTSSITVQTLYEKIAVQEIPTNLITLKSWRLQDSDFNEAKLHQRELFENLKEKILAKASFLKLLQKETLTDIFISLKLTENGFLP